MAEITYNWQSMDYKELSFVDKHLDMSLPEQVELRQQLRDYTAGRVKAFADGSALIQNAAEYKLIYGLINDRDLNGSAADGGKASTEALQAFAKVRGFKNTTTGELDIYDPRCGMSAEEFKASMLKPVLEQSADYKPDGVSGVEIGDKKEIAGGGISQAAAEKMQEQMAQILDTHKMDAGAMQSLQEDMAKQAGAGSAKAPYAAPETSAEKTNEEKELDKGKTDENALGSDLAEKQIELHAVADNGADKIRERQIGEAMLAKETAEATQDAREWKEFAEANMVLAETVLDEKAIVTKIFEGVKEQKDNDYCAIIERPSEDMINVGARKKEKRNEEKRDNENKGKSPEKEPDLNVFRQIFKMAKKRNVNKVVIGDDLSQEAREKATVAAVAEDMKVDGKGKTKEVDLKKDYVKKLPPAVRRKVRNYNVSNLTPEERKKYREKRKILRMSGRIKPKKPEKEIKPENSFVNEKAAELQASVTGKMMPQDMSGFGRE